jgi:polyhydroxyalkanoate synthase
MQMLAEDIVAGKGDLKLRQTDVSKFAVGREHRDHARQGDRPERVCQVMQYDAGDGNRAEAAALLICPPWINKFYMLDLNPQKSFIKWASIRATRCSSSPGSIRMHATPTRIGNPMPAKASISRSTPSEKATGERGRECDRLLRRRHAACRNACPACARRSDKRIRSATLFTTQVDFTHAGDLKVFVDEEQIARMEERWRRPAISTARRWRWPSTCCAPPI